MTDDLGPDPTDDDGDRVPVADLLGEAFDAFTDAIESRGGRVLVGVSFTLMAGVNPNGGIFVYLDEEHGPEDPRDVLDFMLHAAHGYAREHGIEVTLIDGNVGGQG